MATPAPHGHVPVLLDETADLLAPVLAAPDPVVIDMTLGLGGHAAELLGRFPSLSIPIRRRDENRPSSSAA